MQPNHAIMGVIALATITTTASAGAGDTDWPHWRGPNRDWISPETDWSPTGADEPLWTADVGLGYSGIVIAGDRLVTIGFELSDDGETGDDIIWCLDRTTGDTLWSTRFPAKHLANDHGGGALTTPTIDGDHVYTLNRFGRFNCFSLQTGDVLWSLDFSEAVEKRPYYGFAASPLVIDGMIYVTIGGKTTAISQDTHEIVWETKDYGTRSYTNAVPMDLGGQPMLAVMAGDGLLIADRATGREVHHFPWFPKGGGVNIATPLVVGEQVFLSTAYNHGGALVDFRADEPETVWATTRMRNKIGDAILLDGYLYGFDESMLKCISFETGEEQWRVRGLGLGSLSIAGDKLLVLSSKGDLIIADASHEGFNELSRERVLSGGEYWTQPVMSNGRIYCRNSLGALVCLDHRSGAGGSQSPEITPNEAAPDAKTLFAKRTAAMGGAEAWSGVTSLTARGQARNTSFGLTGGPAMLYRAANKRLVRVDLGEIKFDQACDSEHAWSLDPFFGDKLLTGERRDEQIEIARLETFTNPEAAYGDAGTVVAMDFAARPCWAMSVRTPAGQPRTLYFDRETGHLLGREAPTGSIIIYTEHRDFDGIIFPGVITIMNPEKSDELVITIESLELNAVDPTVFERGDAVRALLTEAGLE